MTTDDLIARFLREYADYDKISAERQQLAARLLREFADTVGGDLLAAGGPELRAFAAAQVEAGLAPSTVGKNLKAIRPFYTWAWRAKLASAETLMEIRDVKPPRGSSSRRPRPYKQREVEYFWAELRGKYRWTQRPPHTREEAEKYLRRWRAGTSRWKRVQPYARRLQIEAIAVLALHGGLRREEIYRLQLDDMAPEGEYVVVRSAAKNEDAESLDRAVPWMSEYMRTAVREWLDFRETLTPGHDRPWLSLWTEQHHLKAMRFRAFEMVMHDIGRGWEFHRMRHTAATEWLRAGVELERVSRILGHRRIQQTLEYAELVHGDVVLSALRCQSKVGRALDPPVEAA